MVARNKLTDRKIKALKDGTHGDGAGLYIRINHQNSKQWIYRYNYMKKPKVIGLGSYPDISLQDARKLRDVWASEVAAGRNPVDIKAKQRTTLSVGVDAKLLKNVVYRTFESKKATLQEKGRNGEWVSQLTNHVLPTLGDKSVEELTQHDINDVLQSIWKSKPVTAKKAIGRLKICLEYSESLGFDVDVDIIRKAKHILGPQPKKEEHLPSMAWKDVPDFYASLTNSNHTHLGLRFLILNVGARTNPVRHLKLEQIENGLWRIPAAMMKSNKPFVMPLSVQSLEILDELKPLIRNGLVFPNSRGTKVVSENIFSKYMRVDRGLTVVPHGFRSSFRTWALDNGHDRVIAEMCMAHKVFGEVEGAYIKSDALEKRRELMQEWSDYVCRA
ncbi:tyrosine-type recombinase/integrase [Hirschia litorea]|uniref:Tyrosine-type recombinase/integrase n=1 Tax=Hirschia litorea TaxID=1199156 RepID=A0ABW2IMN8_9PROT